MSALERRAQECLGDPLGMRRSCEVLLKSCCQQPWQGVPAELSGAEGRTPKVRGSR